MKQQFQGAKSFSVMISMLRDTADATLRERTLFLEEIRQGVKLPSKIFSLLVCSSLFLAIYGGTRD